MVTGVPFALVVASLATPRPSRRVRQLFGLLYGHVLAGCPALTAPICPAGRRAATTQVPKGRGTSMVVGAIVVGFFGA
jgi:hypothetical protein